MRTAPPAATTVRSAKHAVRSPCWTVGKSSSSRRRLVPSMSIPRAPCSATTVHRFGLPGQVVAARAARGHEAERNVIAGNDVRDPLADGFDDACAFVPEHHRPAAGAEIAVGVAHVGVAHAGGDDLHEHLTRLRRVELDLFDDDGLARMVKNGRADPRHPPAFERIEVGDDAETGPVRRRDRPVRRDLERIRQQPVAALRRSMPAARTAPRRTARSTGRARACRFARRP